VSLSISRGGNRAGQVGFGFVWVEFGQYDLLEEIGSDKIRSMYVLIFSDFRLFSIGLRVKRRKQICFIQSINETCLILFIKQIWKWSIIFKQNVKVLFK
jgi:hypothetical protein